MFMLKVTDLSTHYGSVKALNKVSFSAEQGKITTVIGANGAGKSTLLRTISALVKPESGSITWKGRELVGSSPEAIVRSGIEIGRAHV